MTRIAIAILLIITSIQAQEQAPWQDFTASVLLYEINDLEFGTTESPAIRLSCRIRSGELFGEHGKSTDDSSPITEFTAISGGFRNGGSWRFEPVGGYARTIHGRAIAEFGSGSPTLETPALLDLGGMRFADTTVLIEAIRRNPNTLRVIVKDPDTEIAVAEHEFRTTGFDVCRFAYACGEQEHIRAACGSSVQPPAPQLRMLKQDIESVLRRYPTNP